MCNLNNEPSIQAIRGDETLADKLHPSRFSAMSPKMAAIVAYILGEKGWTIPDMRTLSITSDGYMVSESCFIGSVEDFDNNITSLIHAAELTEAEEAEFRRHMHKIDDHRILA